MNVPDFGKVFQPQAIIRHEHLGQFTLYQQSVCDLFLPSGQIVACDGLGQFPQEAFTTRLAPGTYPVTLSIAQFEGGDERVACAVLHAGSESPVRWGIAVIPKQDPATLKEGEIFGYPVDSGTGCFVSLEGHLSLQRLMTADRRPWNLLRRSRKELWEVINDEMQKNYKHTRDWANYIIDASTGLNLAVFSSGLGDGVYASYWGFDSHGRLSALVTDFGILPT